MPDATRPALERANPPLLRDPIRRGGLRTGRLMRGFAAGVAILAAAASSPAQTLQKKVQTALANARLGNAQVGVSIIDVDTGSELADLRAGGGGDGAFIPASNLKLLTSGAALLALGKDYEFRTELLVCGDKLVVRGSGDPAFADPELLEKMKIGVDQFVDRLVDSAKQAGVSGIREVVVDDRVFDREHVHPDWPAGQLHLSYCAPVGGVNFHGNVLNVYVTPGPTIGADAAARPEPAGSWINITRAARTVRDGTTEVWLEREKEPFSFKLHGNVRTPPDGPVQVTVTDPGLFFGRVLADRVQRAGLGAGNVTARLVALDESCAGALPGISSERVVGIVRTPISVALDRCNVDSDNLYAESLLKAAGHRVTGQPGSWSNGTSVVRMQVRDRLGAEYASRLVLADGSGLSRNNRVTPELLTRWLAIMAKQPDCGDTFVRSLALAGEEGTMKKRFKGAKIRNEIRGKSGYIREVRTLSGYVTNIATGRRVAFSILVNEVPSGADARAKEFHEKVVELVDQWLEEQCKGAMAPVQRKTGEKLGG